MKPIPSLKKMWETRDELSLRNFRAEFLPVFLAMPLTIIIGDLRFLDQKLILFGVDSNNLIMMIFGLGFLSVLFASERHIVLLLRVSVVIQVPLLMLQLFMTPGFPRLFVYLVFHAANGVCTACCFYFFAFMLNNVERLFTMVVIQLYYAFIYLFWQYKSVEDFSLTFGSVAVMLSLLLIVFFVKQKLGTEEPSISKLGVRESGIAVVITLNAIWYVIMLMAMYITYQEATVSSALYGIGSFAAVAVIFVVMLIFNYSALHLWSLCLVCSVLGIGALHYSSALAVNVGSFFYGMGAGLGLMLLFYLQGGALKRSGSFKLFRLCCLFTCLNYTGVSFVFDILYDNLNVPNLTLAFPAVLVLAMICLLLFPVLQDKLFRTAWTDGYHMADMPLYTQVLKQVEMIAEDRVPGGLTPRETEVFTMLLTDTPPKQIAGLLKISMGTFNFHSNNLYRKLGIQSRTELFTNYSVMIPTHPDSEPVGAGIGYPSERVL